MWLYRAPQNGADLAVGNALVTAERRVAMAATGFFAEASLALLDIFERRLYRLKRHTSIAAYVTASTGVLGVGLRQARSLIAAARFVRRIPAGIARPSCERQVRPLAGCPSDVQLRTWAMALERASATGIMRVSGVLVHECLREVQGAALAASAAEDLSVAASPMPAVVPTGAATGVSRRQDGLQVFVQSNTCEWYTPDLILDLVRELFAPGRIDLDPCSCAAANTRVKANSFFDEGADGLADNNAWHGNVFLNPALGKRGGHSLQGLFFERCAREYKAGSVTQAVVLLKAGVGYTWFHGVLQWPVCFLRERLAFVREMPVANDGALQWGARVQNPHGSVAVYMGPSADKFARLFSRIGSVPGLNAWAHAIPTAGVELPA